MVDSIGVIYYFVLIISGVLSFASDKAEFKISRSYFAVMSFIPVFLLCALRYKVGSDYTAYQNVFYDIKNGYGSYVEPLFEFINFINTGYNNGWIGVFALSSVLIYLPLFYIGYREKILFWVLLLTFASGFIFRSNNLVRQGIATSFFIFAIYCLHNGKRNKFFLDIVISSLFHYTAVIFVIVAFIKKFMKYKHFLITLCFTLIVLSFFFDATYFIKKFIEIVPHYGKIYSVKLINQNAGGGTNIVVYFWAVVSIGIFYYRQNCIMSFLFMLGSVFSLYFLQVSLAFRFLSYLTDIKLILIGICFNDLHSSIRGYYIAAAFFIIMMMCLIYVNVSNGISGAIPYQLLISM